MRRLAAGLALLGLLDCVQVARAQKPLNAAVKSGRSLGIEFELGYHNRDTTDTNYLANSRARYAVNSYSNTMRRMVGELGFGRPWRTGIGDWFPSEAFDLSEGRAGTAYAHKIDLDSPYMQSKKLVETDALCAHELFHTIQRRYINGDILGFWIYSHLGGFGVESTAEIFPDFSFHNVDTNSTHFGGYASALATENPGKRLFDRNYDGALFWMYACEQLGSVTNEPERGVDFFLEVFDEINRLSKEHAFFNHNSLFNALPIVLARHGTNLRDLYARFALCNGIHRLTLSPTVEAQLGGRKSVVYQDDVNKYWGYPKVRKSTTLPFQHWGFAAALGTEYYLYRRATNAPSCNLVGVRVTSKLPTDVAIAGVTQGHKVVGLEQSRSKETAHAFITSPGQNAIRDILVCVSSGTARNTPFGIEFVEGDLTAPTIVWPNVRAPAVVRTRSPNYIFRVPIQVRVEGPDELKPSGAYPRSVAGLKKNQFRGTVVNSRSGPKNVMYVGGDYFLDQTGRTGHGLTPGYYDTEVEIQCASNTVKDLANSSVLVTDKPVNHALVLDRSYSMNRPAQGLKFGAMKEAAALYIRSVPTNHGLALIAFHGNGVEPDEDGAVIYSDPGGRADNSAALTALKNMTLGSATSIGDGLWTALDELEGMRGPDPTLEFITLLTDGVENEGRYVNQSSLAGPPVLSRLTNTSARVHTIALGRDADTALMQGIARESNGAYSYIDVSGTAPPPRMPSPPPVAAAPVGSVRLQTMQAFLEAREESEELERFFTHTATVSSGQTHQVQLDLDASAVTNGLFLVAWNATNAAPEITIHDTGGARVDAANALISTGLTFALYRFERELHRGSFDLAVTPRSDADVMASFSGHSVDPLYFVFRFGQVATGGSTGAPEDPLLEQFEQGVPVQMQAYVATTNGPLTSIDVDITVTLPDGSTLCGPPNMLDDASQGDLLPKDGVYGLMFTKTAQASSAGVDRESNPGAAEGLSGSYRIAARAHGVDLTGQPISREYHGCFQVYRRLEQWDSDLDGIPDSWEIYYKTDPLNTLDGAYDPDEDGVVNSNEFLAGTEPFNPDTDAGGESDGSEIAAGRCPFDPADDDLPPMYDYQIVEDTGCIDPALLLKPYSITMRWGTHPRFETMRIFRSTQPTNGFALLTNVTPRAMGENVFWDQGLTAGSSYYYRFQPVSPLGALGPLCDPLKGTAWARAAPPGGALAIQPPSDRTDRLDVPVRMRATHEVTHYVLSARPLDGSESPVPFEPSGEDRAMIVSLSLDEPPEGVEYAMAYARFMDANERWSPVARALIRFDPEGDADGDHIPNADDPDDDNDEVPDDDEVNIHRTDPFDSDTDGDGLNDGEELFTHGTSPLMEDSDGDTLTDYDEIHVHGTRPDRFDTDGDLLPDGFEVMYGFSPTTDEGITYEDADGDGVHTLHELLTGTDPLDRESVFAARIETRPSEGLRVTFPAAMGHYYRLWRTDGLGEPDWENLGRTMADHPEMHIDLPGEGTPQGYYRVEFEENPALTEPLE